ncbi:hypothetical protein ABH932_004764 [Streptacidiphilus sp. MAP5-52]
MGMTVRHTLSELCVLSLRRFCARCVRSVRRRRLASVSKTDSARIHFVSPQ